MKKITFLALISILALNLTACGNSQQKQPLKTSVQTNSPTRTPLKTPINIPIQSNTPTPTITPEVKDSLQKDEVKSDVKVNVTPIVPYDEDNTYVELNFDNISMIVPQKYNNMVNDISQNTGIVYEYCYSDNNTEFVLDKRDLQGNKEDFIQNFAKNIFLGMGLNAYEIQDGIDYIGDKETYAITYKFKRKDIEYQGEMRIIFKDNKVYTFHYVSDIDVFKEHYNDLAAFIINTTIK